VLALFHAQKCAIPKCEMSNDKDLHNPVTHAEVNTYGITLQYVPIGINQKVSQFSAAFF